MSSNIIKYVPFQSKADPSFWMKLGDHKLNTLRLTQDPIDIEGTFILHSTIIHRKGIFSQNKASVSSGVESNSVCIPGRMRFDQDSIRVEEEEPNMDEPSSVGDNNNINDVIATIATHNEHVITRGKIQILNTLESFKSTDKNELLNNFCLGNLLKACGVDLLSSEETETNDNNTHEEEEIIDVNNGVNLSIQALTCFYCLCHLDLKTHKVLYWFAFPVLTPAPGHTIRYAESECLDLPPQCLLKDAWDVDKIKQLYNGVHQLRSGCTESCFPPFFIAVPTIDDGDNNDDGDNDNDNDDDGTQQRVKCLHLSFQNYHNLSDHQKDHCCFVFLDPTSNNATNQDIEPVPVGWTLRNLVAYITLKLNLVGGISVISYRPSVIRRINVSNNNATNKMSQDTNYAENDASLLLQVQLPSKDDYRWPNKEGSKSSTPYTCVGWELNSRNKPGPRSVTRG